jgi:hypothetical protein
MSIFTSEEREAARAYSTFFHRRVNEYLRGEEEADEKVLATIEALDSAIAKRPCSTELALFRGVDGEVASYMRRSGLPVGSMITYDSFVSTSADPGWAELFAAIPPGGLILKIHVPAGSYALDMAPFAVSPIEREVLLPRGTRLRVLSYDGARMVETEVV